MLSVILGDADGNFRSLNDIKSDIFSALALSYQGNRLKTFSEDSFYLVERYLDYFKSVSDNHKEKRGFPCIAVFKPEGFAFQWDCYIDPVIYLTKEKISINSWNQDKKGWDILERNHVKDRKETLDEGIQLVKQIKDAWIRNMH